MPTITNRAATEDGYGRSGGGLNTTLNFMIVGDSGNRAFIGFSASEFNVVGTTINSATLSIGAGSIGSGAPIKIHAAKQNLHANPSNTTQMFAIPLTTATTDIAFLPGSRIAYDVAAVMQEAIDAGITDSNFLFLIELDSATASDYQSIDSQEAGSSAQPVLTVDYTEPPTPQPPPPTAVVTISFDSATGSDTAASGAGPASALSVANASTDTTGWYITVPNMDLSGVATDGSHLIYLPSEGFRQITHVANSGAADAEIGVNTPFTASLTGQTASVGGKLATLFGTAKSHLEAAVEAGWTLSFASGHSETYTAEQTFTSTPNDFAGNPVKLIGEAGTQPYFEVDQTGFGDAFNFSATDYLIFDNLHFRGLRAGGSNESRYSVELGVGCIVRNCKISASRVFSNSSIIWTNTNTLCLLFNCDIYCDGVASGKGVSGRSVSLVGCRLWGLTTGINVEVFGAFGAVFCDNQIECIREALKINSNFSYPCHITGNIISVDPGEKAIFVRNTNYDGVVLIDRNVITGGGSGALAIDVNGTEAATHKYFSSGNAIHNMVNQISDNQKLAADNTDDPQLSGHPSSGGYSIDNQTVADFLLPNGISPGSGGGGGGETTLIVVDD